MRRALLFLAVAFPAVIVIAMLQSQRHGVGRNSPLATAKPESRATPVGRDVPQAFDVWAGHMWDLFAENPRDITLGDQVVRYQRHLVAAKTTEPRDNEAIRATGITILFNPTPKNEHDLSRLVSIPIPIGGPEAGAKVRASFGRVPGVVADEAIVRGSHDLTVLSRLELKGHVRFVFVDPEVPSELTEILAERLTLIFENGEPITVTSDAAVAITRPVAKDADIRGTGFDMSLKDGRATIQRAVRILLVPPERVNSGQLPVELVSDGPAEFISERNSKGSANRQGFDFNNGRVELSNGVKVTQGDATASSRNALITLGRKNGASTTSAELTNDVLLSIPRTTCRGSRLVFQPHLTDGDPIWIEGAPAVATFVDGARLLPGNTAASGDLRVLTKGRIAVRPLPVDGVGTNVHLVTIPSDATVEGGDVHLASKDMKVWIADLPDPSAGTPNGRRRQPYRGELHGAELTSASMDVNARELILRREFDGLGVPRKDVVNIGGPYTVRLRNLPELMGALGAAPASRTTVAESRADSRGESRPDDRAIRIPAFLAGADELLISGPGTLELVRPPLQDAPLFATAKNGVEVRAVEKDATQPKARFKSQSAELVLKPDSDLGRDFRVVHRLALATAEKSVLVEVPGLITAHAGAMRFDGERQELVLMAAGDAAKPHLQFTGAQRPAESIAAGHILYSAVTYRVTATSGVIAEVQMPQIPWVAGATVVGPVLSTISASEATVDLDRKAAESGRWVPAECDAKGAVSLVQPNRTVAASTFHYDLQRLNGNLTGEHVKITARPMIDGLRYDDFLECRGATLLAEQIVVDGPVHALLHVSPDHFALAIPINGPATNSAGKTAGPRNTTIDCRGKLNLSKDALIATERVVVEQGNPDADGVKVEADQATLLLVPVEGGKGAVDVAVAELRRSVAYRSRDLQTNCDVMVVNRAMRKATMYNERPERVTVWLRRELFPGLVRNNVSAITVNYATPGKPVVEIDRPDINMIPGSGGLNR